MGKRHATLLKINSTEYILAYCMSLVGVPIKEKNILSEKICKIVQNI